MRHHLITLILFCLSSYTYGQETLNSILLGELQDSVQVTQEFLPENIMFVDEQGNTKFDLISVKAACTKQWYFTKSASESPEYLVQKGSLKTEYISQPSNGLFIRRMEFPEFMFGLKQVVTFDNACKIIPLPVTESTSIEKDGNGSLTMAVEDFPPEISSLLPKKGFVTIDFIVHIKTTVFDQQKMNFPYGERLAFPIETSFTFEILDVISSEREKFKPNNIINYLNLYIDRKKYTYIDIFNSYRGVWLAHLVLTKADIVEVNILNPSIYKVDLRKCKIRDDQFQVYPNPSFGDFNIYLNQEELGDYTFTLKNIVGQEVWSTKINHLKNQSNTKLIIPNSQKGAYIYSLFSPSGEKMRTRRLNIIEY